MLNDFFIRALLAGVGIALITGPLGCFVVWRRLSFFAGTLAHSALLGVTMALVFEINIAFSVFLISAVLAIFLLQLQKKTNLPIALVRAFLEISVVSIGWYLGGTVGLGTLMFAFGIGPAVALGLYMVGKTFS